jgi:hypothetical protein
MSETNFRTDVLTADEAKFEEFAAREGKNWTPKQREDARVAYLEAKADAQQQHDASSEDYGTRVVH